MSGSWRLSSKTRGRLLSQRRKYKNAHKYTNGNKSRISQNGILSGFDYDAFINAFESLATGLNQDRTGIGRKDGILTIFDHRLNLTIFDHFWIWPFLTLTIFLNLISNFINFESAVAWAASLDSVCVLRFRIQTEFNQSAFKTKLNRFGWTRWHSFVWVKK